MAANVPALLCGCARVLLLLQVKEFNALSRTVAKCPDLRDRVMKQAYYYRIAAELSASALRDQVEERASPGGSGYARGVLGSGDAKV